VVLSFVPMPFTTEMIAMDMPAAIKPYSIDVAAFSSRQNFTSKRMINVAPRLSDEGLYRAEALPETYSNC
jgi:hypothetical protein